jgi:hypothetical protein
VPASSAIVSRPRYLHANGSEACDDKTWLRACSLGERTNDNNQDQDQGETARVARLGWTGTCSMLSYLHVSPPGGEHKSHSYPGEYLANLRLAIPIRRTPDLWQSMAQTECKLGKLWRGRHQSTELVAFIQTLAAHPRWTSAHRLPGLGRR